MKTCGNHNNANMKAAEEAIKTWFRTASNREGGRKRRADKKKESTDNAEKKH